MRKDKILFGSFRFALLFVMLFFLINIVDSLAVSSICAPRTPCQMFPGEERIFDFLLQSGQGGGEIKVKFELLDDAGGIAQIVGEREFIVPAGSKDVNAKLKVKIPEDAQIGTVNLMIKVSEVPVNEGQVSLSPSFTMSFPINVGEIKENIAEEKSGKDNILFVIAVVLVLAVLIAVTVVLIKNKNEQ